MADVSFQYFCGDFIDSCSGCGGIQLNEKVKIDLDGTNPAWPDFFIGEVTAIVNGVEAPTYTITYDDADFADTINPCNTTITCADCCDLLDAATIVSILDQDDDGLIDAQYLPTTLGDTFLQSAVFNDVTNEITLTLNDGVTVFTMDLSTLMGGGTANAFTDVQLNADGFTLEFLDDTATVVDSIDMGVTFESGDTATVGDTVNGIEKVGPGSTVHFWSSDSTVDVNVTAGSAVVDLKVDPTALETVITADTFDCSSLPTLP